MAGLCLPARSQRINFFAAEGTMMNQNAIEVFGAGTFSDGEGQYFDLVDRACRNSKPLTISNSHPKHAVYLIHTLLSNAKSKVRLLTGALSRAHNGVQVYANEALAAAACSFLSRPDTSLQIAIRDGVDGGGEAQNHPFIKTILGCQNLQGKLELRQCDDALVESMAKEDGLDMHWMTMDDTAFRLEYDTKEIKAFADFGDAEMPKMLNELFDTIFFGLGRDLLPTAA